MANSDNLFTRCFRGFSPEEVISYIDELNAAHKNSKSESDSRIHALTEELDSLKNAAENYNSAKEQLSEKESEIERLSNDNENQRLAMVAQGEKMLALEEEVRDLKTKLEAADIKTSAMEANSKEYEAMLADVESILSAARRQAQSLITEAEKKAGEIIANAEKTAKERTAEIVSASDEKVSENMKKVKYLYRRQDELAELFRDHKSKVDSFFASIADSSSDKN